MERGAGETGIAVRKLSRFLAHLESFLQHFADHTPSKILSH
jgi:hypothetical protein